MIKHIISWDLGATKCMAGLIEYQPESGQIACVKHLSTKLTEATSIEELISRIEAGLGLAMADVDAICIGAAGHYDGHTLQHANHYPYPMHFARVAKQQNWPTFAVIHDYASIICATFTPYMEQASNVRLLNDCPIKKHGRRVAFGIGTGLGLKDGVLFENGDFWFGHNEIGHIGIIAPPAAEGHYLERHNELMRFLQERHTPTATQITFERILAGQGMVNLHQFFYPHSHDVTTPESVGQRIKAGYASDMLDAFAWYLGLFVGTTQLIFMPEGGVWITGGVILNYPDLFERPDFFAGIEASPAYMNQRKDYSLGVLRNHEHALIGCGYYAAKRLLQH